MSVSFEVFGIPQPQGSIKAFAVNGHAIAKPAGGGKFAQWRNAVADKAHQVACDHGRLAGALDVSIVFDFPMPASRSKAQRVAGTIMKTTAPDIDKLCRLVLDALQVAGLIKDDAIVCGITAVKREVSVGPSGAWITITSRP